MRIVAGNLKRRVIKAVPGKDTRPTSDKIKEAIFHKLGPYFTEGGTCLDLFGGSGSLGFEAISRGMEHATFIEKSSKAIKTIQHNVLQLNIGNYCEVYRIDALKALKMLASKQKVFDLIFVDPPYEEIAYKKVLHMIEKSGVLREGGKVYIESATLDAYDFNPTFFTVYYEKKYSSTTSVRILERKQQNIHTDDSI